MVSSLFCAIANLIDLKTSTHFNFAFFPKHVSRLAISINTQYSHRHRTWLTHASRLVEARNVLPEQQQITIPKRWGSETGSAIPGQITYWSRAPTNFNRIEHGACLDWRTKFEIKCFFLQPRVSCWAWNLHSSASSVGWEAKHISRWAHFVSFCNHN